MADDEDTHDEEHPGNRYSAHLHVTGQSPHHTSRSLSLMSQVSHPTTRLALSLMSQTSHHTTRLALSLMSQTSHLR